MNRMGEPRVYLQWVGATDGAEAPIERVSEPTSAQWLVGRGPRANLRIDDQSVAVSHVLLEISGLDVRIQSLSPKGSTWVDGKRLEYGQSLHRRAPFRLQAGRHAWHVLSQLSTVPVHEVWVPQSEEQVLEPRLVLWVDPPKVLAWLCGHPLHGRAASLRLLLELAGKPGEILSHESLSMVCARPSSMSEPGSGGDTHQAVRALRACLDALEDAPSIHACLRGHVSPPLSSMDEADKSRRRAETSLGWLLIRTCPGKGYQLALPRDMVQRRRGSLRELDPVLAASMVSSNR